MSDNKEQGKIYRRDTLLKKCKNEKEGCEKSKEVCMCQF